MISNQDYIDLLKIAAPVFVAFVSGGGITAWLSYKKETKVIDTSTQEGLNTYLHKLLDEERRRCDEQMAILHNRIQFLESQIANLQAINLQNQASQIVSKVVQ